MLNEDVRGHVYRVRDGGRDLREAVGGLQSERCVLRIVEGVDRVVRCSGMVRVVGEEAERDRAGSDLQAHAPVPRGCHCAQNRERVEGGHLGVVRILLVEPLHGLHISDAAIDVLALAPQHLDRAQEALLTFGRSFRQALRLGRSQPLQCCTRLIGVHLRDQRVVVRQRFAPIGHREIRIERLRLLELVPGLDPAEAVKNGDAAKEVLLDVTARGGRKVEGADGIELGLCGNDHGREKTDRQYYGTHHFHW